MATHTLLEDTADRPITTTVPCSNPMLKKIQMIKKKGIFIVGIVLIAVIITTLVYHPVSPGSKTTGTSAIKESPIVSLKVYEVNNGWAYKVMVNNASFIVQEQIPGIAGQKAFQSKADAEKCGKLVVQKIKKQQFPALSKAELDSLGIQF